MINKLIFNGNLLQLNEDHYEKNLSYANELASSYLNSLRQNPIAGEVILRKDGRVQRITIDRSEKSIQANGSLDNYGFYLSENGETSFSGTCGDLIPLENVELTSDFEYARFWFFNICSIDKAHQGIHFDMQVRVWKEI